MKKKPPGMGFNPGQANPVENLLQQELGGVCPFCRTKMNPERWTISDNGYECEYCKHRQFVVQWSGKLCQCKNCLELVRLINWDWE